MRQFIRRGFTLVEILVVISLTGVFLLALAQLQASELRQSKAAATHDAGAARVDAAVKALRADMWVAKSVWEGDEQGAPMAITINTGDGSKLNSVTWKIFGDDHRLLRRVVAESTTDEFLLPAPASIETVHERFSFPNAWGGPGPIPYAIRLHIGDEQVFLPNQGIFTYGFHVMYPAEAKGAAQ